MAQAIARLAPYEVLAPEEFHHYQGELLNYVGAPRDTDVQKQAEEVRAALERITPAKLVRLLTTGSARDTACLKFVLLVTALQVRFAISPGLRSLLSLTLDCQYAGSVCAGVPHAQKDAQLAQLRLILSDPASAPQVQITWGAPAQSSLEPED